MLNNFIYAQTKDLFLEQLGSGNILDETIVFIEETGEIWNRGNYFGSKVDISGCATQEEVQNIVLEEFDKLSKVATTGLYNDLIDKPTIPQHNTYETEALYQEAVDAGEVDENDISFVKETGKIYTQGGEYGGSGTVDTELSDTSENAVQNKTVTSEFNKIWEIIGAKDFSSDFNTDYAIY